MKIFWVLPAIAIFLGCGGSGGSSHEPAPPPAPPPGPAPAPEPVATAPPAPPPPTNGGTQCSGPSPGPGYECVKNCGPPVAQAGDPDPGFSWLSAEQAKNRKQFGCPICLPDDARIATPSGDVAISRLAPGMLVMTTDSSGRRFAVRALHVVSVEAPSGHRLTAIVLADGRRLRASPGHPDSEGQPIGRLETGDALDGSTIKQVERVPYSGRTFDLVLEGGASYYFADGVRVRSSLAR